MKQWFLRLVIRHAVPHLFNTISVEDILYIKNGKYHYLGKPLDEERLDRLRQSADVFANSVLWNVLSSEVRFQLNKKMYYEANDFNDLLIGKAGLHTLDIIEKTLQRLKKEHNN